jgi:hypothetical protein
MYDVKGTGGPMVYISYRLEFNTIEIYNYPFSISLTLPNCITTTALPINSPPKPPRQTLSDTIGES